MPKTRLAANNIAASRIGADQRSGSDFLITRTGPHHSLRKLSEPESTHQFFLSSRNYSHRLSRASPSPNTAGSVIRLTTRCASVSKS